MDIAAPRLCQLAADIARRIARAPPGEMAETVQQVLVELCDALRADVVRVYMLRDDGSGRVLAHHQRQGSPLGDRLAGVDDEFDATPFRSLMGLVRTGLPHQLAVAELPDDARTERDYFTQAGVAWLVVVPFLEHGQLRGAIAAHAATPRPPLDSDSLNVLALLSTLLSQALFRDRSESELRHSETRWRTLAEASFEAVVVHRDGFTVDCNAAACEILGMTRDQLMGQAVPGGLIAPESLDEVKRRIREHSRDAYEANVLHADGSRIPVELRAREFEVDGVLQRVVAVRDVRHHKAQEARLQEAGERLRALVELTFEGVLVHRNGTVVEANEGFARMCGYTLDEVIGMSPGDVTTPEAAAIIARNIRDNVRTAYVVTGVRKDGSTFPMEVHGTQCFYNGEELRITGLRDLSRVRAENERQRQLEERVRVAQRLESLGMLASGVAHDFNNLLVAILGNAELAELELDPGTGPYDSIRKIQHAASRAGDLTRQLLMFAGKHHPEPRAIDMAGLVEETAELARSSLPSTATLSLSLPPDLPAVQGDDAQLGQVILNLLTNAGESMKGRSGRVQVSLALAKVDEPGLGELPGPPPRRGTYVALTVRDQGEGMEASTLRRMFDPFFSTRFPGRGLGLAAVLGIVRAHGGGLTVQSRPGGGTTITVLLPPAVQPGQDQAPSDSHRVEDGSRTLLIVDDELHVLQVAEALLGAAGHRVFTAPSGPEGIATWLEHRDEIDLVLLDLAMPGMRGEEVRDAIAEHDPDVDVIFCSGFEPSPRVRELMEAGRARFLPKPYRMKALQEAVVATR